MMSKKPLINILISIVIIVALFFAYRFFFPGSSVDQQTPGLQAVGFSEDGSTLEPQDEFLQLLLSLQALEFKTDVFDTIHKGGFQDFTVQLVPKDPGRPNPFAPLGSDARSGTTANAGSSTTTKAKSTNADSLLKALNP